MARKITVFPPIERYCFGPPAPARSPRPAATRMAAVRSGLGIVLNDGRLAVDVEEHRFAGAKPLSCWAAKTEQFRGGCGKGPGRLWERHILLQCTCKIARTV